MTTSTRPLCGSATVEHPVGAHRQPLDVRDTNDFTQIRPASVSPQVRTADATRSDKRHQPALRQPFANGLDVLAAADEVADG